jgi:hypothetical protein
MSYAQVSEIIRKAVEDLVSAGASRDVVELNIAPLEDAAVQSIIDSHRDQLLLNMDYRAADLAGRWNLSERQVRNLRKSALDRKFAAAMIAEKAA